MRNATDTYSNIVPYRFGKGDLSQVRAYLVNLRKSGPEEIQEYFEKDPKKIRYCASLIKVLDVNQAAVRLHGAKCKLDFVRKPSVRVF